MANISATEVVYRLRTLTTVEVDSTTLASAAYIAAADSWLAQILSDSSLSAFADLSTDKKNLCKAAELAWVAARVIASAPLRGSKAGPIDIKGISSQDKAELVKILKDEWTEYLTLVGASPQMGYYGFDSAGGSSYMPDDEDDTNIDYVASDPFSPWSRDVND